jgi:serine/threonine protein kinase
LDAFKSIHCLGVIHRDIREDDILVTEDGESVMFDFEFGGIMKKDNDALDSNIADEVLDYDKIIERKVLIVCVFWIRLSGPSIDQFWGFKKI